MKIRLARLTATALWVTAVGAGLGGCSNSGASTVPQVVAAAYPFTFVAEQVGRDFIEVRNLTSPGVEPHDVELPPQQLADLSDADLIIVEGGFQPAVDDGLEQIAPTGEVIDVAEIVTLQNAVSNTDTLDPHIWLDPQRMAVVTEVVADRVASLTPEHVGEIRANARRLIEALEQLDAAYTTGLAECARRTFVTSHAAFGYLASRYNLEMVSVSGLDPTLEPSPAEQAAIADTVTREGVTTIFTETLVSPAVAETIADETGARVRTLDPIEGLTEESSDETYLTLMRDNLAALREANGCS